SLFPLCGAGSECGALCEPEPINYCATDYLASANSGQESSSFSMSGAIASGAVVGAKRDTGLPSAPMRNLVKFHLMAPLSTPFCSDLSHAHNGCAFLPLTS